MSTASRLVDDRRTVRILVADADAQTRARYRSLLNEVGCDVIEAADGRDALVKALSIRPTLVVTDTRLLGFDGYALCRVLRTDSTTRTVPIVITTAETGQRELDRARAAGADIVITKPVTPDVLLREIQSLVDHPESSRLRNPSSQPPRDGPRRVKQVSALLRTQTTTPPAPPPPQLICPRCDRPLTYEHSHIGGVSRRHAEQWDVYTCPAACGTFEYRQRTRRLRRVS